ncbi:MAG TPA: hypothetical protein DEG71_02800 [Clostridiales bacterium]|nr:hypothetical protein [Clostridiales bacterium]
MKKFILGLIVGAVLFTSVSVMANSEENYSVPSSLVVIVEKALSNAESQSEYNRISEILNFISNPRVISSGSNYNPNGKYNFGKSVYEKTNIDANGNITWTRID